MSNKSQVQQQEDVLREVVGVFFEGSSLEEALTELKNSGFDKNRIGLMAHSATVVDKLAHLYEEVQWDQDSKSAPEFKFVEKSSAKSSANAFLGGLGVIASAAVSGVVVASAAIVGGPVGAATASAVVVGGVGALASTIISKSASQRLQSYLEEGHLLLFVRPEDGQQEKQAQDIFSRFSGVDSEVVEFRAAA